MRKRHVNNLIFTLKLALIVTSGGVVTFLLYWKMSGG
jgi:hypothetical protein